MTAAVSGKHRTTSVNADSVFQDCAVIEVCPPEKGVGAVCLFVHYVLSFMSTKYNCLSPLVSPYQDIKNADLALYELNRVITLEPNWPEVYEQRAEVKT